MQSKPPKFDAFGKYAEPFAIGLNLLGDEKQVKWDNNTVEYLAEKQALFQHRPDDVFQMEDGTVKAQEEVLEIVLDCLSGQLVTGDDTITCPALGIKYRRNEYAPLALASLLVPEDLVIMRRKEDGWTLVAASLCFPSSWNLQEKFGKPLTRIHKPVPGANKKLDPMIIRIFDNLKPELPVWRENWSFYSDNKLRHDSREQDRSPGERREKTATNTWIRREYQTLTRLRKSTDILFTIKIIIEPLKIIEEQEKSGEIANTLLGQIEAMSPGEKTYKGFDQGWEGVKTYLASQTNIRTGQKRRAD